MRTGVLSPIASVDDMWVLTHTALMLTTAQIASRIRASAEKAGISPATLSRKLLGSGKELARLEAGGSLRMDTYQRVVAELDAIDQPSRKATGSAR